MRTAAEDDFPAWWLEAGPELCTGCEVSVHFEALTYCVRCDRPFCALCIMHLHEESEMVCGDCLESD